MDIARIPTRYVRVGKRVHVRNISCVSGKVLGRDLVMVLAAAEKGLNGAISAVVADGLGSPSWGLAGDTTRKGGSKAGKFLETLQV